ncbi:UPF0496 protein [Spatholobus suberectus]|nr:UPF0496 protein [Spatholobus suberectus]
MGAYSVYVADLRSYEAMCSKLAILRCYHSRAHQQVITSLTHGVGVRSITVESLGVVTSCLLEMNQDVAKVILECKQDIWNKKDKELFSLVEDFFEIATRH